MSPIVTHEVGCAPAKMPALPGDLAVDGAFGVGVRTVEVAGLVTEVWYPAQATVDGVRARYWLRGGLPATYAGIPDVALWCDCTRDAPLDVAHGAFPTVLYLHGYGLDRVEAFTLASHWASLGMIVASADYPGMTFADVVAGKPLERSDLRAQALVKALPEVAFLAGHVDTEHLALAGHSMGADVSNELTGAGFAVSAVLAMAEAGTVGKADAFTSLILGGTEDKVEPYDRQQAGFDRSPHPAYFVGIRDARHLSFSDSCTYGAHGQLAAFVAAGVPLTPFQGWLSQIGCADADTSARTATLVRRATSAVLADTLLCSGSVDVDLQTAIHSSSADIADFKSR